MSVETWVANTTGKSAASALTGAEILRVIQGGVSKALTITTLAAYLAAGSVTSVGLSAPAIFSVSGSPVTTSGTLALSLATQSANLVWAGPNTGSAATPTFRALVAADLPTITTLGTITSGTWQGSVIGPAYGGTGVANNSANTITFTGSYSLGLTLSNTTALTLPTSGTLATLAGSEAFTNKTYNGLTLTTSTGTFTLTNLKTLTVSNTLTFTGTDSSSVAFGTGGTVLYTSNAANPSASVGLSAVNGSATTFMRSDGAPALNQAIVPTWTGQHTFAAGTITTSQPLTLTQTWNAGGVTFTGFKVNITDTASAAASLLADFQVASSSLFNITKAGAAMATGGSAGAPGYGFIGAAGYGFSYAGNTTYINSSSNPTVYFQTTAVNFFSAVGGGIVALSNAAYLNFSSSGAAGDTSIARGGAGVINIGAAGDASGTLSAANVSASSTFTLPGAGLILSGGSDGVLAITNSAASGFVGLLLGPSGTTYNRIKHDAAGVLAIKLADDSAYSGLRLASLGAGGAVSATTFINLAAGTTAASPLRFVQGVAPTSPVDGDVWREDNTNTGLKVRINGVTKTVTVA